MKDPAVLFYPTAWFSGTRRMTNEEKGMYIDALMIQADEGFITEDDFQILPLKVQKKFVKTDDGYINARMDYEKKKRSKYAETRRQNGKKGGRPKDDYCGLTKVEWDKLSVEERMILLNKK